MDILQEVDKIKNNLELPATSDNPAQQIREQDLWGTILNGKTFKTINDNFFNIKKILVDTASEINDFNNKKSAILLDIENLKTDTEKLESFINVDSVDNNLINVGQSTKKLNLKVKDKLLVNGQPLEMDTGITILTKSEYDSLNPKIPDRVYLRKGFVGGLENPTPAPRINESPFKEFKTKSVGISNEMIQQSGELKIITVNFDGEFTKQPTVFFNIVSLGTHLSNPAFCIREISKTGFKFVGNSNLINSTVEYMAFTLI